MKYFICSCAEGTPNCRIYNNWIKQTKENRLDVIKLENKKYHCLALDDLFNPEKGIPMDSELFKRLKLKEPGCAIIESLNNQLRILRK